MDNIKDSDIKNIVDIIKLVRGLKGLENLTDNDKLEKYGEFNDLSTKLTEVLNNNLSLLDYESIKVIKTVMCLGKYEDYDFAWKDKYAEYSENLIDSFQGKELDIESIVSEFNLDAYLWDGLKILCKTMNITVDM